MSHNLTMTDLFCGAGGSSTGAVLAPGVEVRLAANHWDLAIETHNANHPDTDHLQADISQVDPRYIVGTDILWASPECTNHSKAKGRRRVITQPDLFGETLPDAAAERSRATMWDVVRFAEAHSYRAIIVENVVEVADWSSPMGVKGGQFRSWLTTLTNMGYSHRIVSLNSMHAQAFGMPAPQSRDRVYIVLWRTGERAPDLEQMQRPHAFCAHCGEIVRAMQSWKKADAVTGKYRSQYLYRCPKTNCKAILEPAWLPAASIIDWSNPGTRIGDREKPLADKTMARIRAGIERYWMPILTETANPYDASDPRHPRHGDPDAYYRSWPLTAPTQVMHTRESKGLAYLPVMVPVEGRDGKQPFSAADVMRAQTTRSETGVAFLTQFRDRVRDIDPDREPLPTVVADGANHGLVSMDPLMVPAGGTWNKDAVSSAYPARARTTREAEALLFPPFIAEMRGGGSSARDARDALAAVTAGGINHALVMGYYSRDDAIAPASAPLPTATAEPRHALLHRMNHHTGDGSYLSTPVTEPARTLTAAGHQALLQGRSINVDEVFFRMLEPKEIKKAMAFPDEYRMLGTRREQVRLAGNAVTPPAARDLVTTVAAAITGEAA